MRKKLKLWLIVVILFLTISCQIGMASAITVDVDHLCSLTLTYGHDGQGIENLPIEIYKIGEFYDDGQFYNQSGYRLTEEFAVYPVNINKISSKKQWSDISQTLSAYIEANGHVPVSTVNTNKSGIAKFDGVETGIYLVKDVDVEVGTSVLHFETFLVFLPTPQQTNQLNYDVEAVPKYTVETKPLEYTVVKLWEEFGFNVERPESITVDIVKDGELYESIILNSDNNWSYSWTVDDPNSEWTVVEKEVPDDYLVSMTLVDNVFTIVNAYTVTPDEIPDNPPGEDPVPPSDTPDGDKPAYPSYHPETGDTNSIWQYVIIMAISGLAFLVVGGLHKRY